jgi:hypothetical protein
MPLSEEEKQRCTCTNSFNDALVGAHDMPNSSRFKTSMALAHEFRQTI